MPEVANNQQRPHAWLGPSSSDIWLTCLQAPAEWEKVPPRTAGFAAHEGTLAHTLCEAAILLQQIPWLPGQVFTVEGDTIVVTDEMLNAVQLYLHVTNMLSDFCKWRIIEKQLPFGWLWENAPRKDLFGTVDFGATDGIVLYVCDFKYGRGKAVSPDRNTQLLIYALACLGQLKMERPDLYASIETVSLVIIQPRAGGQPVRQWDIPLGELLYWAHGTLMPSIDKIVAKTPMPLVPGSHCFFCPASFTCPAYKKLKTKNAIESFPEWIEETEAQMI